MKIQHQNFRDRCLFCGARTQNSDPSPTAPREATEDILWRPARKGTGSSTDRDPGTGAVSNLPSGRTTSSKALNVESRSSERPSPPSNGMWHTTAGPIVDDLYDDCPQARYFVILFFVAVMLPVLLITFGWQIAVGGLGLGGLFFKLVFTAEKVK